MHSVGASWMGFLMKVCHIKVCVTSQSLAWVSNATCIEHKLLGANVNDAKSHKDFHRRFALFGTTYVPTNLGLYLRGTDFSKKTMQWQFAGRVLLSRRGYGSSCFKMVFACSTKVKSVCDCISGLLLKASCSSHHLFMITCMQSVVAATNEDD